MKNIFEIKLECYQANGSKTGSVMAFSNDVKLTDKGMGTDEGVNIVVKDPAVARKFEPGKKYLITVTESE